MLYKGYIYKTTCLINKKIYVGQHRGEFNPRYLGSGCRYFQRAIKRYGKSNFKVEILEFFELENQQELQDKLNEKEKFYIKELKSQDTEIGYNYLDGGQSLSGYLNMVKSQNEEDFRKRMSETISRIKSQPEVRKQHSMAMIEKWKDKEWKEQQIKKIRSGKQTEECKQKTKAHINKLHNNPEWHKKLSARQTEIHNDPKWKEAHAKKLRGRKRYNNGIVEILDYECPKGFVPGCLPKGCWWNNGIEEILSKEQPDGFIKGRLPKDQRRKTI